MRRIQFLHTRVVEVLSLGDSFQASVLRSTVKHSQELSAAPLHPWIAAESNGRILCASCMAGLGETCSHIAALLLAAEAHAKSKYNLYFHCMLMVATCSKKNC